MNKRECRTMKNVNLKWKIFNRPLNYVVVPATKCVYSTRKEVDFQLAEPSQGHCFNQRQYRGEAGATESRKKLTSQETRNRSATHGLAQGDLLKLSMSSAYVENSSIMTCLYQENKGIFYCNWLKYNKNVPHFTMFRDNKDRLAHAVFLGYCLG